MWGLFHLSCRAGDMRLWQESVGLVGFSPCPSCGKAPRSAKTCPRATIDRISLSVCVRAHVHVFVCVPARVFVCRVCVKDSCSFCFLEGPRANPHPACPNAPFFRGQRWTVIVLSPPLINPSQRQSTHNPKPLLLKMSVCLISELVAQD